MIACFIKDDFDHLGALFVFNVKNTENSIDYWQSLHIFDFNSNLIEIKSLKDAARLTSSYLCYTDLNLKNKIDINLIEFKDSLMIKDKIKMF